MPTTIEELFASAAVPSAIAQVGNEKPLYFAPGVSEGTPLTAQQWDWWMYTETNRLPGDTIEDPIPTAEQLSQLFTQAFPPVPAVDPNRSTPFNSVAVPVLQAATVPPKAPASPTAVAGTPAVPGPAGMGIQVTPSPVKAALSVVSVVSAVAFLFRG